MSQPLLRIITTSPTGCPTEKVMNLTAHDYWMALFDYQDRDISDNVTFHVCDVGPGEFPIRAVFKRPVYHDEYKEFRRCPNFPDIYISRDGSLYESMLIGTKLTVMFSMTQDIASHYMEATVPCCYNRKFVSLFRIYADAWANPRNFDPGRVYPVPKDGDWTNLKVGNVMWRPRYENQMLYEKGVTSTGIIPTKSICMGFTDAEGMFDKLAQTDRTRDDVRPFVGDVFLEECGSGDRTHLALTYNVFGNNRDYCYYPHWYCFVVNGDTGEILPCHSLENVICNLRAPYSSKEQAVIAPAWSCATVSRNFLRKNMKDILVISPTT